MTRKATPLARDEQIHAITVFSGWATADGDVAGTTIIDTKLVGVNDYVTGKGILILSGACQYEMQACSSFVSGTGTITIPAFSARILQGVLYRIMNFSPSAAGITALAAYAARQASCIDFWSDPQEEIAIANVAADKALPDIVVALPSGATVVKAVLMFKFRAIENTNAAVNKLNGAQDIQIRDDTPSAWIDAINFVDDMFGLAASTREGGDVVIGDIDVKATVDGDDTYNVQWDEASADQGNLQMNDVQVGLRIWYR